MLVALTVKNFAIIENLTLEFKPGLNVLTGETGAGKSIIVDAVGLLLGNRGYSEYIREGEERSYIEGIFQPPELDALSRRLEELGVEIEEDGMLILSREISRSGKNLCRVNGRATTLNVFREIGQFLIDLHGQQEQQSLLSLERQMELLDSFAGEEVGRKKERLREIYRKLRQTKKDLESLRQDERDAARRIDLLSFQLQEIEAARLHPQEEERLEEEKNLLQHAERLARGAAQAYQWLYGGGSRTDSAYDLIGRAESEIRQLRQLDASLQGAAEGVEQVRLIIEEVSRSLRRYSESLEPDPRRLESVEERLSQIRQLKRKYGDSVEEVLRFAEEARAELSRLNQRESLIDALEKEYAEVRECYRCAARELTELRREAASRLERELFEEFIRLQMGEVKFAVKLRESEWGETGQDEAEFMISPNPGEPMKPLSRIASGGETSRIMLALKAVLARVDRMPTLIFDEIDTGIGGRALEAVSNRLGRVAAERQVICVTHAPQIASRADHHLLIDKQVEGDRTRTRVSLLEAEERVREIARMLAGSAISPVTIRHAEEMLSAGKQKNE